MALLGLQACVGEDVDHDEGALSAEGFPEELQGTIEPVQGFYRGRAIALYDFGTIEPLRNPADEFAGVRVHPMYLLVPRDELRPIGRPIVDVIPPSPGYSPFFQIVRVEVDGSVGADDLKSQATMLRRSHRRTYTSAIVHCPFLAEGAEVVPPPAGDVAPAVVDLWWRGWRTRCLALEGGEPFGSVGLGPVPADEVAVGDRTTYTVPAQDVYLPEVRIFDEEVAVPDSAVVDRAPGDAGYSPVGRVSEVKVSATYVVGGFDELTDIDPTLIEPRVPEEFVDLPNVGGAP